MLRLINLRVQANKTITINNPIRLKQGDFNVAKLVINPSLYIKDYTNVLGFISFKRPDNKQTGQLLLTKEPDNTYTYVIKDPWLVDIAGELWFTISFDKILRVENGNPVVDQRLYTGNASIYLDPDADYTVGGYLPPNDTEQILTLLNDIENRVSITEQEIDDKLNKDFTTYPKLDWETVEDTDLVVLNRIDNDGNITQYNAEAKDLYNSVNDIFPNEDGNIELDASDIPYENTNVSETLNELEETTIKTNENVVYYSEIESTNEPIVEVTRAQYAINDNNGNNIVNTYATKTQLSTGINNLKNEVNAEITSLDGQVASLDADLSTYNNVITSSINDIVSGTTTVGKSLSSNNATNINNLNLNRDSNGVLKIGDTVIPQKILVLSSPVSLPTTTANLEDFIPFDFEIGNRYEIHISFSSPSGVNYNSIINYYGVATLDACVYLVGENDKNNIIALLQSIDLTQFEAYQNKWWLSFNLREKLPDGTTGNSINCTINKIYKIIE